MTYFHTVVCCCCTVMHKMSFVWCVLAVFCHQNSYEQIFASAQTYFIHITRARRANDTRTTRYDIVNYMNIINFLCVFVLYILGQANAPLPPQLSAIHLGNEWYKKKYYYLARILFPHFGVWFYFSVTATATAAKLISINCKFWSFQSKLASRWISKVNGNRGRPNEWPNGREHT